MSRKRKAVKLPPYRVTTLKTLKGKFPLTKARVYEKAIFDMCQKLSDETYEESVEEIYRYYAYEKTGQLWKCDSDEIKEVLEDIKEGKVGDEAFYRRQIFAPKGPQDTRPVIRSGVYRCRKKNCRSYKTKETDCTRSQDRSGDEGMTTYVVCRVCGDKYSIGG